jgi:hypothetical protein
MFSRARPGRGYQEFMGAVCYQRSGCPSLGVCTTHLESFSLLGSPLALKDLVLGYSYLEGSYEWL